MTVPKFGLFSFCKAMTTLRDAFTADINAVQGKLTGLADEIATRRTSLQAEIADIKAVCDQFPAALLDMDVEAFRQLATKVFNRLKI